MSLPGEVDEGSILREGKIRFILRAEEAAIPEIKEVPSIFDFAKTSEQRQLMRFVFSSVEFGRPYAFPPETPRDRVDLVRRAIAEAVKDPELIAEADKMNLDMSYRPPEHLERVAPAPPALRTGSKRLAGKAASGPPAAKGSRPSSA